MPWKETSVMEERMKMIGEWLSGEYGVSDLSRRYGVSRPTIYKWLNRYGKQGPLGLLERSRATHTHSNQTDEETVDEIVRVKKAHLPWGPRKVMDILRKTYPEKRWPVDSTASEILKREGLVKTRRKRRRTPPYQEPFQECSGPNRVVSADFKGQFKTGDGRWCYPLTVSDNYSRYLMLCRGLIRPSTGEVWPWFKWLFREYGLPDAIRTDNGGPFASVGIGGLTRLSVWFIKLGIIPERIMPGHPEQNGRHERMHRTLKDAVITPACASLRAQQKAFDAFRLEYNTQRPHEALNNRAPSSVYLPSPRRYPEIIAPVEYDEGLEIRKVRTNGEIKFKGQLLYVSEALKGEHISLRQVDDSLWDVHFSFCHLGILDELTGKVGQMKRSPF
jgi:putative transposase